MNKKLLRDIKAHILAEPDAFRMDTYSCGTAHCIAGWAVHLHGMTVSNTDSAPSLQRVNGRPVGDVAAELLEITPSEAVGLFNIEDWPEHFVDAYDRVSDEHSAHPRAERAAVAASLIDDVLDKGSVYFALDMDDDDDEDDWDFGLSEDDDGGDEL